MSYIVKTRDDFYLDGVSALEYGLAVEMPQPVPPARQRYTTWKSGDTDITDADDSFENIRYSITARRIKTPDDFRTSDLYAALATAKTLQLTRNADVYYKIAGIADVQTGAAAHGNELTYRITFILSPFAYHTANPWITPTNNVVSNPGNRYSRPLYKITHSGACSIAINGQVLQIAASIPIVNPDGTTGSESSGSPIFVDSERMIAYIETNNGKVNQTKFTTGLFPFLSPGSNVVAGSNCTIDLKGNWRDF